jgi:hypothetical protein
MVGLLVGLLVGWLVGWSNGQSLCRNTGDDLAIQEIWLFDWMVHHCVRTREMIWPYKMARTLW